MFNCSFAAVCADPISLLVFFLLTLVNSNFAKIVNVSTHENSILGTTLQMVLADLACNHRC
jgi:hypothetical protein